MKSIKIWFVAAGLALLTAFGFMRKGLYITYSIYASQNPSPTVTQAYLLIIGGIWVGLTNVSTGRQAAIMSSNGNGAFLLYYNPSGITLLPVYTTF